MCGIAGVISSRPGCVESVKRMGQVLAHRGPDDEGVKVWPEHGVGLAHRRLSIIDLSPAGHNPMPNEDHTVWIVFNGEIYNFKDLRLELQRAGHTFRSSSDTEVILHAYEEWGEEHVRRLRGMFAYAIYDQRPQAESTGAPPSQRGRIFLARDRLGIKPLFYYWNGETFCFGSEIKAILACPGLDRELDRTALYDYLTYLYVPPPKTAYLHIRKLPPAHFLILDGGPPEVRRYWQLQPDSSTAAKTESEAIEQVREVLEESVRLHMVSDVPLGVFLSGGMDSSSVTALMVRQSQEPVRTFTIGFDVSEYSETHYARLVAQQFKTDHHERVVGVDVVRLMLSHITNLYDEPYADGSAVPTYYVSKLAREGVKVVLSGDGGDEVFAGYRWYFRWLARRKIRFIPLWVRRLAFAPISNLKRLNRRLKNAAYSLSLDDLALYAHQIELFMPREKRALLGPHWNDDFASYDDYWHYRRFWRHDLDPITRAQYLDLHTYLPDDILTKVDRASMAVSLEVRPPLLDHRVVETLIATPSRFRFARGEGKPLLKAVMKTELPPEILTRAKRGFAAPWEYWLETEKEWALGFLRNGVLAREGMLQRSIFADTGSAPDGLKLWALLVFEQWFRKELGKGSGDEAFLQPSSTIRDS